MYRFADLTHEQKLQRRELLDWYGFVAQLSVLVPLAATQVYIILSLLRRKWSQRDSTQVPSSPYAKAQQLEQQFNVSGLAATWRKFSWWCGDAVSISGVYLGTRGEVIGAGIWTLWLLLLSFLDTGDDYLHLTKRFGIVGASQLPFHYLLSLKSPYSPLQLLTRRSHESLISIHQLLGRIVTFFFYTHVVLYINFYIQSNLLLSKITQAYIICGILGTISFTAIGTTALKPVRDWSYRVFYIAHVALATAVLPLLYFHVHHIRVYIYETLLVYAITVVLRIFTTKTYTGTVKTIEGDSLVEISIPIRGDGKRGGPAAWQPGQHAYLSLAGHPLLRTFRSNPFTVASLPLVDGQLRFVAKILDGNTARMARTHNPSQRLSIEGPYGLATHAETLLHYDRVLFVAGGVGATFIVPLYRQLLDDLSPSTGSQRRQRVNFLWVARSTVEVSWAIPSDPKAKEGFAERLRVYLTKDTNGVSSDAAADITIGEDEQEAGHPGEGIHGIELEEQKKLLSAENPEDKGEFGLSTHAGRPDLARAVEQTFIHSSTERVAILVCGPRSLSQELRQEVGRWVRRGRDVLFWEEHFNL
ncbi:related to ferric reductase [Lecanosticta acicola]|uniref:ferric-chelate reductase (NADPH) n=1 Tax=Lecanosticta acicola TaxID=111012 RepID=A0AAI9E8N2_9PEZI|nr:related to ferric reductase [Lecanosticta acicola]